MSKVKYRIRSAAVKDLEGIWEYTYRKWSKDQADRYHGLILNEIEYVCGEFDCWQGYGACQRGISCYLCKIAYDLFQKTEGHCTYNSDFTSEDGYRVKYKVTENWP